jgi:hypothetical protein
VVTRAIGLRNNPPQSTYLEVLIFDSVLNLMHPQGLGGHVAYNINGTVHSWESGGWKEYDVTAYLLRQQSYRTGEGYVLGDENDPDWSEEMAQKILSFRGDGAGIIQKLFGTGPYALRQDNCGEAFCRATNNTPGLAKDKGRMLPSRHKEYIEKNMRPYIRAVNHYGVPRYFP